MPEPVTVIAIALVASVLPPVWKKRAVPFDEKAGEYARSAGGRSGTGVFERRAARRTSGRFVVSTADAGAGAADSLGGVDDAAVGALAVIGGRVCRESAKSTTA
jgi:hypothetical protein